MMHVSKACIFFVLKTLLGFILLITSSLSLATQDAAEQPPTPPHNAGDHEILELSFSQVQSKTAVDITHKLAAYHYSDITIDNELSSEFFDNYIKRLDPTKLFLLQSDIDDFEIYRFTMDDNIKKGDLSAGLVIFNRYQKRVQERLQQVMDNMHNDLAKMDFSIKESIEIDREQSTRPKNLKEADILWEQRIKSGALSLKLAKKNLTEIEDLLKKRYANQLSRVKQTNNEDAFEIFINSFTQLYDPHTSYLSPRTSENFNINMKLSLEGIGAVLQQEDEYTQVVRLIAAGPADKQGELKPADRITGVGQGEDGEMVDVVGWRLDEVVDRIRGKKGSLVRLEIIPAGAEDEAQKKIVRIERNRVKLEEQSAKKEVIKFSRDGKEVKIGVISLPTFYIDFDAVRRGDPNYKSTTRDVKNLISELVTEKVDGVIIDLRDNGGGSLEEATSLTELFIDSGPTVQIRNSNGRIARQTKAPGDTFYAGPLAVLINRMSASASEIFAGAIQDYQRGLIIGSQSFGKGTVQLLTRLRQGQLKLTQSKFYRISGDSTQHRGVIPDVEFPSLYDNSLVGESSLEHAMAWDQILPARHNTYVNLQKVIPHLRDQHVKRIKTDPDFIYMQDQLSMATESRDKKTISLSEEERLAEKKHFDDQELTILNKRRVAKGLAAYKTLKESEDDKTEKEKLEAAAAKKSDKADKEKDDPDAYLEETGQILVDTILMQKNQPQQEIADTQLSGQGKSN